MSGMPAPTLTPGPPGRMLQEAIGHLKASPADQADRADLFEVMAAQIEAHSGGSWSAARSSGSDGSVIFLGRVGEGVVIAPNGRLYRGSLGRGMLIGPGGVTPDYSTLTRLD